MSFLYYDVCNIKLQLYAKGLARLREGEAHKNCFLFPICYIATHILNRYLCSLKSLFADNLMAKPTTFTTKKISFFLNFYLAIFMVILREDRPRSLPAYK